MPTLAEVESQIKSLAEAHVWFTRKEIKHLPEILMTDELVGALTSGFMNGSTWLIVCTNKRVIFLDKGFFGGLKQVETPLEKINSIQHETGLFSGEIAIWDGSSKMSIQQVPKKFVVGFVKAVNAALEARRLDKGSTQSATTDVATQLEKLAALRDKGILSPAEFDAQKKKILA